MSTVSRVFFTGSDNWIGNFCLVSWKREKGRQGKEGDCWTAKPQWNGNREIREIREKGGLRQARVSHQARAEKNQVRNNRNDRHDCHDCDDGDGRPSERQLTKHAERQIGVSIRSNEHPRSK